MQTFRGIWFLFVLMIAGTMLGCGGFASSIQIGATQETVEKALGKPKEAHKRWMPNKEQREVWVYHASGLSVKNHLYPDTDTIVFSNGKVVAKNPSNPYAPLKLRTPEGK